MNKLLVLFVLLDALIGSLHAAAIDGSDLVVEKAEEQLAINGSTPNPIDINEDCHQPKETGRCFALFHRYAFNIETSACEEFVYGGCAGNSNNFETKEDCEKRCMQAVADNTEQPATTELLAEADAVSTTTIATPAVANA